VCECVCVSVCVCVCVSYGREKLECFHLTKVYSAEAPWFGEGYKKQMEKRGLVRACMCVQER